MSEKVLVCITIQENSRRLISEGAGIASKLMAPLNILHVRKGETIFDNPESTALLEDLFDYGSELGGEVHFSCGNDTTQMIKEFIIDNHITHLVLGVAPRLELDHKESVCEQLIANLPLINISVLSREDYKFQEA